MSKLSPERLALEAELIIEEYGDTVEVLKLDTGATPDVYGQSSHFYQAPVPIKGVVSFGPQPETISAIGDVGPFEGMITFSKNHLERAFPLSKAELVVENKDELGFQGYRWRVLSVHKTGPIRGSAVVVLVFFAHRNTKKYEVYP